GTLDVRQIDPDSLPIGPNNLLPIVAYDYELLGTSLQRETQLTFTYPAHPDGSIIGSNGNPELLAPYFLQGVTNWLVMGPRQWDSSQHTVSVTSPHLST